MPPLLLVTGATGYVGTRLIPELLAKGYRVRCLVREPKKLRLRPWFGQVEVVRGDVLDAARLPPALDGVHAAFYLVHNMSSGPNYREHEKLGAQNFGAAAKAAGVEQIIYVGGLGEGSGGRHMASRRAAGDALRASGVPVTEFRASVIIGSGSISFEMIRTITEWFPLVPAPIQTNVPGQPIATPDLLAYLLAALENPASHHQILEIGGADVHPYPALMLTYAQLRGLRRGKLTLPFFHAALSARIADWLTPVPYAIARPLMEELVAPSIVQDDTARRLFPSIEPMPYAEAVRRALTRAEMPAHTPWMDSLVTRHPLLGPHTATLGEGLLIDYREAPGRPSEMLRLLFDGKSARGWQTEAHTSGAWMRMRGRSHPFGVQWLEVQYTEGIIKQAALFEPKGLPGLLWWNLLRPFHTWRFGAMFAQMLAP